MPDILIRGLEMPREDDLLCLNIHPNGDVIINLDLKCIPIARAVELPQHGDLIDRDRLKHKFCTHCDGYEYDTNSCVDGDQDCMDARLIMNAPVVVPAERRESGE